VAARICHFTPKSGLGCRLRGCGRGPRLAENLNCHFYSQDPSAKSGLSYSRRGRRIGRCLQLCVVTPGPAICYIRPSAAAELFYFTSKSGLSCSRQGRRPGSLSLPFIYFTPLFLLRIPPFRRHNPAYMMYLVTHRLIGQSGWFNSIYRS